VAFWSGDARRALELIDESIAQGVNDWAAIFGDVRGMQIFALAQLGDTERAIAIGEPYLADARKGVGHQLASALWLLGLVYVRRDPKRARELIEESLACDVNYQRAWTLVAAGQVRHAVRDHLGAIDAFAQAITLAQATGDRAIVPVSLEGMARALRQLGEPLPAIRLFAAAEAARDHLSLAGAVAEATSRDHAIDRLRAAASDEDFTASWQRGRNLGFDATIALALDEAAEVKRQAQASAP
jgi:tetratricopeptide (TPR) repeat protein